VSRDQIIGFGLRVFVNKMLRGKFGSSKLKRLWN
jgi:hypothetical protein